jgi:hypothetical protein
LAQAAAVELPRQVLTVQAPTGAQVAQVTTSARLLAAAHCLRAVAVAVPVRVLVALVVRVLVVQVQAAQTAQAEQRRLTLVAVAVQQQAQAPVELVVPELFT